MITLLCKWLAPFALWILKRARGGMDSEVIEIIPGKVANKAVEICRQIEEKMKGTSGTLRRVEALRTLMNVFPQAKERDLDLAIDYAVRKL